MILRKNSDNVRKFIFPTVYLDKVQDRYYSGGSIDSVDLRSTVVYQV